VNLENERLLEILKQLEADKAKQSEEIDQLKKHEAHQVGIIRRLKNHEAKQDKAIAQLEQDKKRLVDCLVDRHYYNSWQLTDVLENG
jgi:peptidoglycan hydrolase CwlO-like protein